VYNIDFAGLKDMTNKWIQKAWNNRERYQVFKGGGGSGKSYGVAQLLVYRMIVEEGHNILVIRKVANTLRESCFSLLKEVIELYGCSALFTINKSDMSIECINGNRFILRGLDDAEKIKSINSITDVWIEEANELDVAQYRQLNIRLRGRSKFPKQMYITFNPTYITHWLKAEFFDNRKVNSNVVETTYKDNRFLDEEAKQVLEDFKDVDPYFYMVYCMGFWGITGGNYFKEFRQDIHVVAPIAIPEYWKRYVSIDYGLDMLAALWFAVDTHNNAYVYKELYESDLIISDAAKRIKEVNAGDKIDIYYAPPDLDNRRQETGKSALDIFFEHGIPFIKSNNNRVQGWFNVKEWLKPSMVKDEQTGEEKMMAPLRIFPICKNLIRCLPQIQTDDKDPNDCSSTPHEVTHINDSLRYFACMRVSPSVETTKKKQLPWFFRSKETNQNQVMEW